MAHALLPQKASISVDPPKETPPLTNGHSLEDVKMAEVQEAPRSEDVNMHDDHPGSPNGLLNGKPSASGLPPASSSGTIVDSLIPSSPYSINVSNNDDDDKPPPAKRARKYSDAEKASISNVSLLALCAVQGVLIFIPLCVAF